MPPSGQTKHGRRRAILLRPSDPTTPPQPQKLRQCHSGQTPDEMYFGTGDRIPEALEADKKSARQSRMKLNRATSCQMCQPSELIAN